MAKTNAQKQREYKKRKKLESDKVLEKEKKRQKKYYGKRHNLLKTTKRVVKEKLKNIQRD